LGKFYKLFSVVNELLVLFLGLFCSVVLPLLIRPSLTLYTLRGFELSLTIASCLLDLGLLGFLKLFKLLLLLL
jgi:hypothetical protein